MGKRKAEEEKRLRKKIRKLEKKLERLPKDSQENITPPGSPPRLPSPQPNEEAQVEANTPTEDGQLPEEFLLALGKEGEEDVQVGDAIRPELALRWAKIMSDGLGKDARGNIISKYPTPSNFPNAIAPLMNAEIMATLSEPSIKRDRRIVTRQNLTGKMMTCLGRSLTNILKGNINSKTLIEEINDAAKIAAEIHYQDSSSRKFFALSGATKIIQEAVKTSKIDTFLFGADCADKIKAAQSIQRTSTQISESTKIQKQSTAKKQLNWKGPLQNRQPTNQQYKQARGGPPYQQQTYKQKQPRWNQPRQTERKHPPVRSRRYR